MNTPYCIACILFALSLTYAGIAQDTLLKRVIPFSFPPDSAITGKGSIQQLLQTWKRKDSLNRARLANAGGVKMLEPGQPLVNRPSGYISYTTNYRSGLDTPFVERNLLQHQLMSRTSFSLGGFLPLQLYTLFRRTNSPYFADINDVQIQLDTRRLQTGLMDTWRSRLKASNPLKGECVYLAKLYQERMTASYRLNDWLHDPAQMQELVRSNEVLLLGDSLSFPDSLKMADSLRNKKCGSCDSLKNKAEAYLKEYERRKAQWQLLQNQGDTIRQLYAAAQEKLKIYDQVLYGIPRTGSGQARDSLRDSIRATLPGYMHFLSGITNFSVGRTQADYTELTVKDMSINGVNAEYSGDYYAAIATGSIDYRFRDFMPGNVRTPAQYLYLLRFGKGSKEGTHLIASFFGGKRQRYGLAADSGSNPVNAITGISLEGRWDLSPYCWLSGEVAKSNAPLSFNIGGSNGAGGNGTGGNGAGASTGGSKSMWNIQDKTSRAWAIRASASIPSTHTSFSAMYTKMGANFQSFRYYAANAATEAWNITAEQYCWRRTVHLAAGVRKNDFTSPYASLSYSGNSLFWTLRASVAIRRLPTFSIGYMPSSQLSVINNKVVETYNQVLQASSSYSYQLGTCQAYSAVFYTRLYSRQPDSSLPYFNAKTILVNQSFIFDYFSGNLIVSHSVSPDYALNVIGYIISAPVLKKHGFSLGTKISNLNNQDTRAGFNASGTIRVNALGDFQLAYEKSWLPGNHQLLVLNEIGSVTYLKQF